MKVAVIGNGNVGMATFRELQKQREIQELVLIEKPKPPAMLGRIE